MPEWSFLTNHGLVLSYIAKHPRSTAREIASALGITERTTMKMIATLVDEGYIVRKKEGRRNRYHIELEMPLGHDIHQYTVVGDLLRALGWKKKGRPRKEEPTE